MREVVKSDDAAAYALAIVYANARKDVVLLMGADDFARFWLNGRLVLDAPEFSVSDWHAVAVTLEQGRNTLLAKVANLKGHHNLTLRISDTPADFAQAYAQAKKWDQAFEAYNKVMALEPGNRNPLLHRHLGEALARSALAQPRRWKAARDAFERAASIEPNAGWVPFTLLRCYLALDDAKSYRPLCEQLIAKAAKDRNPWAANNAVWLAALLPGGLSNYDEAKKSAKKLVDGNKVDPAFFRTYGAILYRTRADAAAIRQLERAIEAQTNKGSAFDWVFLAMARHRLKQPGDKDALERAEGHGAVPRAWTGRCALTSIICSRRLSWNFGELGRAKTSGIPYPGFN